LSKEELVNLHIELIDIIVAKKDSSDNIWFTLEDKKLTVMNTDIDDQHEYTFSGEYDFENNKSKFSSDIIIDSLKYYKEFDTVKISIGTNIPIKFEFSNEYMDFISMAAPRIDPEDE
jgi:hypothetical protein